jgi:CRP-like cAMP-binding protein
LVRETEPGMARSKAAKVQKAARNAILAKLDRRDLDALADHLEPVDLPVRTKIEQRQKSIEYVYFMESGIASVVAKVDREVEIGIIGRDGLTGVSVLLGAAHSTNYQTYMQIAGSAQRIRAQALREAMAASTPLRRVLLLYAHAFLNQVSQTALANARGTIGQRLARWILMVNDRIDGADIPLTHEFLAIMLGTNRPGVTLAVQDIERRGVIVQKRGALSIADREALEKIAGSIYSKS